MIERRNTLKRAVQLFLAEHNVVNINANEHVLLERMALLQRPFLDSTNKMSEDCCNRSAVIPDILAFECFLSKPGDDQGKETTKNEMLFALRNRFLSTNRTQEGKKVQINILKEDQYVLSTGRTTEQRSSHCLLGAPLIISIQYWILYILQYIQFKNWWSFKITYRVTTRSHDMHERTPHSLNHDVHKISLPCQWTPSVKAQQRSPHERIS